MIQHVAVAIVGFNNADDIVGCVSALERATHGDFEVIICENGGPVAYAGLLERLPATLSGGQSVRVVLASGNLGFAGGVNTCIRETPAADAWWVLNPDTEPFPEAMACLAARLARGDCEAVGGMVARPDGSVQSLGGSWQKWMARPSAIGNGRSLDSPADPAAVEARMHWLSGASFMVNRRFVETVGLMREDYFLYCEEVEWCLRARTMGMRLGFAPAAIVVHHHGTTTGAGLGFQNLPRTPVYLDSRNRILLTRDVFPRVAPIAFCLALLALVARYAKRGAWRPLGYALRGWAAGVMNKRGRPSWIPA